MEMKTRLFLILTLLIVSSLSLLPCFAQDFSQWDLPEGAEARFGKGIIESIAYSPDGSRLAVGASTGIWIYDAATGEERSLLGGHTGVVVSIAYSRDGKMLASAHNVHGKSGHAKHYVALWDVATGTEIKTLYHEHRGYAPVRSVAFSPDGTRIAVGDNRGGLLWDVATGTLISTLDHNKTISSVKFSPDGRSIASGNESIRTASLALWDGATGAFKKAFHPTNRGIRNVAYSPDGTILACATTDGRVILWDVAAGLSIDTFVVFDGNTPNVVAYSPDGKTIAVAAARKVSIWDAATGRRRHFLGGHIASIRTIAYSPDGSTVASGGDDGTVRFWNASTGALRYTITGHTNEINAVAFSPDGTTLAIGGDYSVNTISLWDVATHTLRSSLEIDTTDFGWSDVYSLAYSPDGSTIAGGNYQATYLWDAATQKIRHRLESTYRSLGLTYSPDGSAIAGGTASRTAALSPDGTKLVTPGGGLSGDNVANLSDVATGRIVKSFTFSELTARDALIVWDVETRRIIDKLPIAAEDRYVRDIAYSPDGNTIAAAVGSSVYLWDATIGRLKSRLTDNPLDKDGEKFMSVAFSPDGTTLASGGGLLERTVLLWDVKTGDLKSILRGHSNAVVSLAFSPDGTTLASGSHDGTVLLWSHIHSAALPPVFTEGTNATRTIAENTAVGVNIGTPVAATDADDDVLTYTLSGADAAAFSIDPTTGQLKTRATLDYETKSTYTATITVSDGTFTSTITVTISVTDIDETPPNRAPVFTDGSRTIRTVAENVPGVDVGAPITATDADNDTLTYTLSGRDAVSFDIDSTTGQLRTRAALDHETKSTYTVIVTASDGMLTNTISVTINVTSISEVQTNTHIHIDAVRGSNAPTGRGSAANPYKSITYALLISERSNLPDPWYVHIHPGTYNADPAKPAAEREIFPLNLRSGMIFEGTTTAQECIIDAQHLGATQTEILRGLDVESVVIRNLTLQNMKRTTSGAGGITLWSSVKTVGVVYSRIAACIVQNNGGGGVRTNEPLILTRNSFINNGSRYDHFGVLAANNVVATQNTFRNNNVYGLLIKGDATGNISDNIFTHHGYGGCNGDGTFTGNIAGNTFDSNKAGASDTAGGFSIDNLVGNITDNIFTNNNGNGAGGFYVRERLTGNITHNTFTNNTGNYDSDGTAGAFFVKYLNGNVTYNTFTGNKSKQGGGGFTVANYFTGNITHNEFTGNNSGSRSGGGFSIEYRFNGNITHNIFDSNSTGDRSVNRGGAFILRRSTIDAVEVNNNIFFNNTAVEKGGTVYTDVVTHFKNNLFMIKDADFVIEGTDSAGGTVWVGSPECRFHNNIFSGMQTAIYTGGVFDLPITHNLFHDIGLNIVSQAGSGVGNDVDFWELLATNASDNISGDPHLVDPGTTRNFHLQATSPAINAGTNEFAPADDFEGVSRPVGDTVDIGPYEYGGTPVIIVQPPTVTEEPTVTTEEPPTETVTETEEPPTETVTETTVRFSPSSVQSPAVGEQLTFDVNIENGKNVANYQVTVQFDTTALRYISSANADYLPAGAVALPAIVTENTVKVVATSLTGGSNGDGVLATLTFEVVAAKASTLTLSNVLLSDGKGGTLNPRVEDAQITEPQRLREDVNNDGVVNVQDLVAVSASFGQTGENAADVNGDGKVNIADLVLIANALGTVAETPEPINNAPVFTEGDSITRTVAENTAAGINIGTPVVATDADSDTLTYSLSGEDADTFSIDTTTGQLKTRATLDYETKTTYTVTITVSDGSLTDTIAVTINITDIDETPVVFQGLTVSLSPSPVQSPAIGAQLTLNVNIANGENIAGYQVTLQFDTTALRYVSSADAGYLPSGAFVVPAKVTANSVTLTATAIGGGSNGDGTLATITFEVLAVKASTLKLTEVTLSDSASQSLQVASIDGIVTGGAATNLVSGRTPQVRDAIVTAAGVGSVAEVTESHLAAIVQLDLNNKGITALKASDFDGMTSLTGLNLGGNDFNTLLLQDIFDKLTSLTVLILPDNDSTTQLIGKFSGQVFSFGGPNQLPGTMFLFKPPSPRTVAGAVGDVNLDGIVNILDLTLVMLNFGKTGDNIADTNDDGVIDIADLVNVIGSFGQTSAAPSLSSKTLTMLTAAEIEALLTHAQKLDLTDPMVQQWIATLEHLLAALTPKETLLLANYPNPFNPETWIPYQLAKSADVTLRIYAIDGTLVRTLSVGHQLAGMYHGRSRAAYWDGKNELGEPVASGVYFYTLTADDFTATRKMLIQK